MAPNRKNVTSLVETLSSHDLQGLQSTVDPKFLPLTHPNAEQQVQSQAEQDTKASASASASYWDWPTENIQPEEEKVDLFSVANIESNLIQAAIVAAAATRKEPVVAEHDSYWAEKEVEHDVASAPVVASKPQHVESSYWEWPADQDSKKATIARILEEERAYKLVSGASIEAMEATAASMSGSISTQEATSAANNDYWRWEAATANATTANSDKYWDWNAVRPSPVQAILEYEAAREFLTAENVVRQLQKSVNQQHQASETKASSDDYWREDSCSDDYWNTTPAVVATGKGYWDW